MQAETWRAFWRRFTDALAPIGVLVFTALSASAQAPSDFTGNLSPPFQGILAQPSDLNNTLQYAAAASADDIESAIGTYEQLLFYNPTLSRVRFELGVLYFRLGSYEMARSYFQSALQMRDIAPDLSERAQQLIEVIDKNSRSISLPATCRPASPIRPIPGPAPAGRPSWRLAAPSTAVSSPSPIGTGTAASG